MQDIFDQVAAKPPASGDIFDQVSKALPPPQQTSPQPQPSAIKRFLSSALGVPEDVFEHPNKWMNPFSSAYNSPEHQAEVKQALPPPGLSPTGEPSPRMPGAQTFQDIKSGNYAGAAGDIITPAIQLAGLASIGRGPVVDAPSVYEGPMPAEIPVGRSVAPRDLSGIPPLVRKELLSKVPGFSRITGQHSPTFSDYANAIRARGQAQERPVYGNTSNAEARGPYQPLQGDLTVAPESAGQNPVPQEVSPEINKASGEPTRLPSQSALSGESALRQVLTGQDNGNLMRIAKSRGINVTKEAQLKPGIANPLLVEKIVSDFSPDELDEVGNKFLDNSRFGHNFGDIPPEASNAVDVKTYFPDVKLPAAVEKRLSAILQQAAAKRQAIPPQALQQAAAANATMPQELAPQVPTSSADIIDLLQKSLKTRGK